MTTHFRLGSNCECIDRHRDLLLFCPFLLSFSIFLSLRFPFCITLRAHLDQVLHTVVLPGLNRLNSEGARLNR